MIWEHEVFLNEDQFIDGMGRVETAKDYEIFVRNAAARRGSWEMLQSVWRFGLIETERRCMDDSF